VPRRLRSGPPGRLYAWAASRARRIVAVSEGTKRSLVEAGVDAGKIDVVPNLVDVSEVHFDPERRAALRAEWGAGESTLVAGCISRFQRRKRNDVVVDAMAHLDGDVLLVMAGEGEEEPALRQRAAPYGERVRFVPNVRGHVEEFLSACDVLVFAPSPTEGAPRVIVMAQLIGVPVIATHPEGAGDMVPAGTGTITASWHDPAALAEALSAYAQDRERARREGQAGRELALERYAPERTLRAIEDALGLVA
jgi:glycosyltransferase involved in cell wall biosynthesis